MERLLAKAEAGARWCQTQPVYDLEVVERFFQRTRSPIPVVVGVLPLHSSRHAVFLHNEVPGITVPDGVRARMKEAGDQGLRAGTERARARVSRLGARSAATYLFRPSGRSEVAAKVPDPLK